MKWEYKVVQIRSNFIPEIERELNCLGNQEWELVDVISKVSHHHVMVFKRQKKFDIDKEEA